MLISKWFTLQSKKDKFNILSFVGRVLFNKSKIIRN